MQTLFGVGSHLSDTEEAHPHCFLKLLSPMSTSEEGTLSPELSEKLFEIMKDEKVSGFVVRSQSEVPHGMRAKLGVTAKWIFDVVARKIEPLRFGDLLVRVFS